MHTAGKDFTDTKNIKDETLLGALLENDIVKITAKYLEQMFEKRKTLVYE